MVHYSYRSYILLLLCLSISPAFADQQATALVKAAIDYWRDKSSYSVSEMIIHRPDWKRTMTLRIWTQGMKDALVRVITPKKDKGNATLTKNDKMWNFSPKTGRVIKIPSSMMNQGWMGSDFSYRDISKGDDIVEQYTHRFIGKETGKILEVNDQVRARIIAVSLGTGRSGKLGLSCRAKFLGHMDWIQEDIDEWYESQKKTPKEETTPE